MNKIRKKLGMLLAICLLLPCFSIVAHAASGVLTFSDPTTKVGETVTVKAKLDAYGSPIGDGDITVTYDPAKLEFVSGQNASGGSGTVTLSTTGDGSVTELNYTMEFRALAEGTTNIEVSGYTAYLYNDETLDVTLGSSAVTIEPGDGTVQQPAASTGTGTEPAVTVNGINYNINGTFADVLIPEGFVRTTLTYEGQECQVLQQETSGLYMIYLTGADGTSAMFLYNSETGEFSACEKVRLSDTNDIFLMQFKPDMELPSEYKSTEFEMNGVVYPAWQDPSKQEFYIVYALNSAGQKNFYQYDASEATYQRYVVTVAKDTEEKATGFFGKIESKLKENLSKLLIGVWAVFIVMLIILIVLVVKLKHRNEELDDWYEDFGDEYEKKLKAEQAAAKKAKQAKAAGKQTRKQTPAKKQKNYGYAELDEFEDELDDDFYEDDMLDDERYDDYDDDYDADAYDDDSYDDYDDDYDDYEDDYDRKKRAKETAEFSLNFIDLD